MNLPNKGQLLNKYIAGKNGNAVIAYIGQPYEN